jgi:hypothetical protein
MGRHSKYYTALDAVTATVIGSAIEIGDDPVEEVYMQVDGVTTATMKLQGSLDNSNWYDISLQDIDATDPNTFTNGITADGLTKAMTIPRYIRPNMTAYTAGTVTTLIQVKY